MCENISLPRVELQDDKCDGAPDHELLGQKGGIGGYGLNAARGLLCLTLRFARDTIENRKYMILG